MSLLAPVLLGSLATPAPALPVQDEELLTLYVAEAAEFFSDPKDASLLAALRLIDDRVAELSGEIPDFPMLPPGVIELAAHLLTGEKSLRIGTSSDPNMVFPVYAQLQIMEGDAEKARQVAGSIVELGRMVGAPLGQPREDGMLALDARGIEVLFGARGNDVVLSAGKTLDAPIDLTNTGLPEGVEPTMALHFDLGATLDMVMPFLAMAAPEEAQELEMVMEMIGVRDLVFDMASGTDAERSHSIIQVPGYAAVTREMGMMPVRGIEARDIAVVPQDAVWASISTINAKGTLHYVLGLIEKTLAEEGMGDPVEMVAAMTGFHIETDFVDHLGPVIGMYASDTTGGGGMLSIVAFMELANAEGMLDTTERVQDILNGLALAEAEGYVQLRSWEHGETQYTSVTFPGLPVPLEPTVAITDRHMFMGVTPQATVAAVKHATSGSRGLLDNERFRENMPGDPTGAYSVSFYDTPRFLGDGYGMTSMLCSAIVNGTRSRTDGMRDAGIVMPSFHELAEGAKASVGVTRIVGDDFVSRYQGDKSALVNLTSTVGFIASSPLIALLPLAVFGLSARQEMASQEWAEIEARVDDDF